MPRAHAAPLEPAIDDASTNRLLLSQRTQLLQSAREALSNCLCRTAARQVLLTLQAPPAGRLFTIADEGAGFDPAHLPPGGCVWATSPPATATSTPPSPCAPPQEPVEFSLPSSSPS